MQTPGSLIKSRFPGLLFVLWNYVDNIPKKE
jgi:hypothetical protein